MSVDFRLFYTYRFFTPSKEQVPTTVPVQIFNSLSIFIFDRLMNIEQVSNDVICDVKRKIVAK